MGVWGLLLDILISVALMIVYDFNEIKLYMTCDSRYMIPFPIDEYRDLQELPLSQPLLACTLLPPSPKYNVITLPLFVPCPIFVLER